MIIVAIAVCAIVAAGAYWCGYQSGKCKGYIRAAEMYNDMLDEMNRLDIEIEEPEDTRPACYACPATWNHLDYKN